MLSRWRDRRAVDAIISLAFLLDALPLFTGSARTRTGSCRRRKAFLSQLPSIGYDGLAARSRQFAFFGDRPAPMPLVDRGRGFARASRRRVGFESCGKDLGMAKTGAFAVRSGHRQLHRRPRLGKTRSRNSFEMASFAHERARARPIRLTPVWYVPSVWRASA